MSYDIDLFSPPLSISPTQIVLPNTDHYDGPDGYEGEIRLNGTGLGVNAQGVVDRGTITSIDFVELYDGVIVSTSTVQLGTPYAGSAFAAAMQPVIDLRAVLETWTSIEIYRAVSLTATEVRFAFSDGTILVATGTNFTGDFFQSTVTGLSRVDASGNTLDTLTTGLPLALTDLGMALGNYSEPIFRQMTSGDDLYLVNGGIAVASPGDDTIDGGNDPYGAYANFENAGVGIEADLADGSASSPWGDVTLINVSSVEGASTFSNILRGDDLSNGLWGGREADLLEGRGGDDWLYARDGDDTVDGGSGDDEIVGGDGDDILTGGQGSDTLYGEGGSDIFVVTAGPSADNIWDFNGVRLSDNFWIETGTDYQSVYISGSLNASRSQLNIYCDADGFVDFDGTNTPSDTSDDVTSVVVRSGSGTGPVVFNVFGPGATGADVNSYGVSNVWDLGEGVGTTLEAQIPAFLAGDLYAVISTVGAPGGAYTLHFDTRGQTFDDRLDVSPWGIETFSEVMALATDTAEGVEFAYSGNGWTSSVLLNNVAIADLDASDFIFVGPPDGTTGNDLLIGFGGGDDIGGLAGDDTLVGGDGVDTLDGGAGDDIADYGRESGSGAVTVNLAAGTATDTFGNMDSLASIEGATGTDGNDILYGSPFFAVTLSGGAGDDEVWGYAADGDVLDGGDGTNLLAATGGGASVTGGGDTDYILTSYGDNTVDAGGGNDWVFLRYGTNQVDLGEGYNLVLSMDLYETGASDYFAESSDTITGGALDDYIYAGRGEDVIDGGAGNDWIAGGEWSDTMTGGAGYDRFIFVDEAGFDVITDFNAAGEDFLDFTTSTIVNAYADLVVAQSGADVFVGWNNGASGVTLQNVSISDFTAADVLV